MAVSKEKLHELVDNLDQQDQKAAFDFLEFLVQRANKKPKEWEIIDASEQDHEPLSQQELEQLNSNEGYVSGKDAEHEFKLRVKLP